MLFMQAPEQALGGSSGWLGAGLLGLVLMWLLLRHLPSKDKQLDSMIESQDRRLKEREDKQDERLKEKDELLKQMLATKNAQLAAMIAAQDATQKLMHEQNQRALAQVIEHCKEEVASMATRARIQDELLSHGMTELTQAITEFHAEIRSGAGQRWLPHPDPGAK